MLLGKLLDNVILGMQEGGNEDHDMEHHPDMTSPEHNMAPSIKK